MQSTSAPPRRSVGDAAQHWWSRYLKPADDEEEDERRRAPAATRAQLRRCRSPVQAATLAPAVQLARDLDAVPRTSCDGPEDPRVPLALDLARVLAHVREDTGKRPMQVAGWGVFPQDESKVADKDRPLLSEMRFRRLLQAENGERRVDAFVRLLTLIEGKVNVAALANDFWYWNDRTKQQWAFDYYHAYDAAASAPTHTAPDEDDAG